MSDYISELTGHLQAKQNYIIEMEKLLRQQEILFEQMDYIGFGEICNKVDRIVVELKNLDYEIAILESSMTQRAEPYDPFEDEKITALLARIKGKAEDNRELLNGLAGKLVESRNRVRKELDDTVALGRISGYRPYEKNIPVYSDETNQIYPS